MVQFSDLDKETVRILKNAFLAFEYEKSGTVLTEDIGTIVEMLGHRLGDKSLKQAIKESDPSGSGKLEFEPFACFASKYVEVEEDAEDVAKELREAFLLYDRDEPIKKSPQRQQPLSTNKKQDEQKAPQAKPFNEKCEEKNGRYTVAGQCDAYVECRHGEPEEELCADGLVFNDKVDLFVFPCQYPIDFDCSSRAKLQPPQATEECPHQFGYFGLGDDTDCGHFMNCADGRGYTFDCPDGLAFNKETYRCDWPDQVPDCNAEQFLGFSCPPEPKVAGLGQAEIRFYRSPNSCQKYFACLEGRPRMYNCGEGNAFNDLINGCDGA